MAERKTKIDKQNAQINSGLIYYWSITPTCFGPSVEAIIRDFEILESYKAIVLICQNVVMYMCSRRDVITVESHHDANIYRVSQEECEILRESVPYVQLHRYNPKHLYPKLNGYGDNGQRKVWTSCISAFYTPKAVSRANPPSGHTTVCRAYVG